MPGLAVVFLSTNAEAIRELCGYLPPLDWPVGEMRNFVSECVLREVRGIRAQHMNNPPQQAMAFHFLHTVPDAVLSLEAVTGRVHLQTSKGIALTNWKSIFAWSKRQGVAITNQMAMPDEKLMLQKQRDIELRLYKEAVEEDQRITTLQQEIERRLLRESMMADWHLVYASAQARMDELQAASEWLLAHVQDPIVPDDPEEVARDPDYQPSSESSDDEPECADYPDSPLFPVDPSDDEEQKAEEWMDTEEAEEWMDTEEAGEWATGMLAAMRGQHAADDVWMARYELEVGV